MSIKSMIKNIAPKPLLRFYHQARTKLCPKYLYRVKSYSQNGEDRILERIYERQEKGFYIDVGAHHPFRFSNTCLFYQRGWNGINIDAMPQSMRLFGKYRKRDINIECGIGLQNSKECVGGG